MSDIAVTWAKAQACVDARGRKDRNAKQVLVHLASYADAEGEVWALVKLLALEMDVVNRTVQRGLASLKALGLLEETGRQHRHSGRLVPVYRLPLEKGHANTKRRMAAERTADPDSARGDTAVTPSESAGCHGCHPTGDTDVAPRGDTAVTQIGKLNSQPNSRESACAGASAAFEEAVTLWASKAPERTSPARADLAWRGALERRRLGEAQLLAAVRACVRRDPDFRRGKAMNFDRWLNEDRFEAWLIGGQADADRAQAGERRWPGPPEIREAIAARIGEGGAASYLDPAGWDGEARRILTPTAYARDHLRRECRAVLAAAGITVEAASPSTPSSRSPQ